MIMKLNCNFSNTSYMMTATRIQLKAILYYNLQTLSTATQMETSKSEQK